MVDPRHHSVYLVSLGEIVLRLLTVPELPQGLAEPDEEAGHDPRGVTVVKSEGWEDCLTVGGGCLPSVCLDGESVDIVNSLHVQDVSVTEHWLHLPHTPLTQLGVR